MSPHLQVHLFGSLEISHDGRLLPKPATLKSQSLFAYLILHRQSACHRTHLSGLFWGHRSEAKARGSLATALWHIRRCLPEKSLLLIAGETVQFDPQTDIWVDVEVFESLVSSNSPESICSAVDLYRGDFLAGFYYDWILDERYHLESLYSSALAQLMSFQDAAGDARAALLTARRLLAYDSLREDAHRLVMRAYCQLGQRNQALEHFRICRETLLSDLGVEPMAETMELYQAILDGNFQAAPAPAPFPTGVFLPTISAYQIPDPLDPTLFSRMVGREKETALLNKNWGEAITGHGKLVFIGGEAGIGKTRLVEEFANSLSSRGTRVLWGRCYEFERILPYQPVVDTLKSVLPILSSTEAKLLPPWLQANEAQFPSRKDDRNMPDDAELTDPSSRDQPHFFESISNFLAGLSSGGPLLIVLEDLHWATESTLQLLHYLVRHLVDKPVLLLCTYRSEEIGLPHPFWNFQHTLQRENYAASLQLMRLPADAVEALVMEMAGGGDRAAHLARRLYQETEGNPFFLMEMVKALFGRGIIQIENGGWKVDPDQIKQEQMPLPESISKTILSRVRGLDVNIQNALHVAAVLGREFDFELLDQVWGRGEEATLEALDGMLRQRLIEEGIGHSGRDYVFTHHKIRETVYSDLSLQKRKRYHAHVGAALEKQYSGQLDLVAGEIAYHFEKCRDLEPSYASSAIMYLLRAGDRARVLFAFQDAIGYYQRALVILEERRDYELIARAKLKLGLTFHSMFAFSEAHAAYEESFAATRLAITKKKNTLPSAPHALRVVLTPRMLDSSLSLDPINMGDDYGEAIVADLLFSRLVELTPDLDILPEIAQDWQVLEDGRKYVFHLREDVFWSDGEPVTAQDFVFSWKRMLDPRFGSGYNASLMHDIKGAFAFRQGKVDWEQVGICALNAKTLEIELENPTAYFLYLLTLLPPVPKHAVIVLGDAWARADRIVTSGSFLLESWEVGIVLTLVRNPAYRGVFPGNVERVQMFAPGETDALLKMVDADGLDVLNLDGLAPKDVARQQRDVGYTLMPVVSTRCLIFDTHHSPFDDRRVRQAFVLATDREELVKDLWSSFYLPATGGLVPPGMPGHSPEIGLPFDPPRARELLAEAGYPEGRGFPCVEAWGWDWYAFLHQCLGEQWHRHLNIEIPWKVFSYSGLIEHSKEMSPDLGTISYFPDYPDPDCLLRVDIQGESNWGNRKYTDLVEQARFSQDHARRMHFYRQAEEILVEDAAVVPLFYHWFPFLIKPWVGNFTASPNGTWFLKYVTIESH